MSFNPIERKVVKCDLCDGDPQCVRFCDVKAVQFVDSASVSLDKKRSAASRLKAAQKQALALHEEM
jgi:Fe-S-cluster-containing hydrogenase component 2